MAFARVKNFSAKAEIQDADLGFDPWLAK